MDEQTELLRKIYELLQVMAEPALAARDKVLRAALAEVVGNSKKRADFVLHMDGSKSRAELGKVAGIDSGNVSRLVGALRERSLIKDDDSHPQLTLSIPANFFEGEQLK